MRLWILLLILFTSTVHAQYKDGIVVVQYRFYLTDHPKLFQKDKIVYLPTVILYHNRKEIVRVESNISLTLPENTLDIIQEHINKIKKSKF